MKQQLTQLPLTAFVVCWFAICLAPILRVSAQTSYPIDIGAFQGIWHEVARSPNFFQRKCCSSTAEYRLQCDGSIAVTNRCMNANGNCKTIQGTATSLNSCNNQLAVSFPVPFGRRSQKTGRANYIIHHVSPDYQTAVVGTPRGRLVWILSRDPGIPDQQLQHLKCIAAQAGYRTDNLVQQ